MARSYDPIRENIKENIKLQTLLQKYQISINPNSMGRNCNPTKKKETQSKGKNNEK